MPVAAVFGSARVTEGHDEYEAGREMGRLLGTAGWAVMTGGYMGVMEAVSRGAHEAGGHVIGVTVTGWSDRHAPNAWVLEERPAADLIARLTELVAADALIAVGGGVGTLAEVALSWNMAQKRHTEAPVILVGPCWERVVAALERELVLSEDDLSLIRVVPDPASAADLLVRVG
jgi:uncharacterized protein (TIGR00730 family)